MNRKGKASRANIDLEYLHIPILLHYDKFITCINKSNQKVLLVN